MKSKSKKNIFIFIIFFSFAFNLGAVEQEEKKELPHNSIAVVKSQYDNVENLLDKLQKKYDLISYRDIENKETYKKYQTIFFPCGINFPLSESFDIAVKGAKVKSIHLEDTYYEIDKKKVGKYLKRFVKHGGRLYFSDYSGQFLKMLLKDDVVFYDNFANIGAIGNLRMTCRNELADYCRNENYDIYMNHNGWVAVQSIKNSMILAEANFKTPVGKLTGPLAYLVPFGSGEIIFTSYHQDHRITDYERYFINRLSDVDARKKMKKENFAWQQKTSEIQTDIILKNESYREYRLPVKKGKNTVRLQCLENSLQMDLFDNEKKIVSSINTRKDLLDYTFSVKEDGFVYVRIYPLNKEGKYKTFAVSSSTGEKFFPYYIFVISILGIILLAVLVYFLRQLFYKIRFSSK